jgi:RecJ-like exonuclease
MAPVNTRQMSLSEALGLAPRPELASAERRKCHQCRAGEIACPTCHGQGDGTCYRCTGRGKIVCITCGGAGIV